MISEAIRTGRSTILVRGRLDFAIVVQRGCRLVLPFRRLARGLLFLVIGDWTIRAAEERGFRTEANADGTVTLYAQACPTGPVMIPDAVEGRRVTRIGQNAFAGCVQLTNLMIPDGVTEVGDGAFAGCTRLTNVVMGKGVIRLADMTFAGCSRLALRRTASVS